MSKNEVLQDRRNDYDVTNTVQVSSPRAVRRAVGEIFAALYPQNSFDPVWLAFHDFDRFFNGLEPEYHGVDTTYHDIQHSLDMTLALGRLIAGYEVSVESKDRLGAERAALGLVSALFHDAGYLRHRREDRDVANGAVFTLSHVSRGARFLERYLPRIGLESFVPVASQIVHFTGYEKNLDDIELDDPRDSMIGHLLGTADLIAQLADRCYLEKCRDRLYPEFVLGGVAIAESPSGARVHYRSGRDLLSKTLRFYQSSARMRLERNFNGAYRYVEAFFDGENPYVNFIRKNITYLNGVVDAGDWAKLRRSPPCSVPDPQGQARLMSLALQRIHALADSRKILLLDSRKFAPVPSY